MIILQVSVPPFLGPRSPRPTNLHVPHGAEYRTRDDDRRGLWRVEAGREHLVIGEHLDAAVEELADEILAHRHIGVRIDGRRWNAREEQTGAQVLRVNDRVREEEHGAVGFRAM